MTTVTPSPPTRMNLKRKDNEATSSVSFVQYTNKYVTRHLPSAVLDTTNHTTGTNNNNQQHVISPDSENNAKSTSQHNRHKGRQVNKKRKQYKTIYNQLKQQERHDIAKPRQYKKKRKSLTGRRKKLKRKQNQTQSNVILAPQFDAEAVTCSQIEVGSEGAGV